MAESYFILEIETAPQKMDGYFLMQEEEQKKLLNPMDSRIVAIGMRHNGESKLLTDNDEKKLLQDFWWEWKKLQSPALQVIGFNIARFDIPFIITRSFVHNVPIVPFTLKSMVDLRDRVNAYRHGPTRGTLREYAKILGMDADEMQPSDIARLYSEGKMEEIKERLFADLEVADLMYRRLRDTNILGITRW